MIDRFARWRWDYADDIEREALDLRETTDTRWVLFVCRVSIVLAQRRKRFWEAMGA